ncbi:MAG: GDP-L-fucose synthase [Pseudomonadota bacterium]
MPEFSLQDKKIWVAGHTGMVGQAILRRLEHEPCEVLKITHDELDLTRQQDTENWIESTKPDVVIIAAAKVGGIGANMNAPAEFIYQNMAIAQNVIHGAYKAGVEKLLFLGSSCIYPREAKQPITEDCLLSAPLELTNEAYAIAKIAGVKLAQFYRKQYGCDYISAMPTNLYGPNDNFDPETGHVIPALIHKIHKAKKEEIASVAIWGTGAPSREFMHVDDLADALVHVLKQYSSENPINIGSGEELSIMETAKLIQDIIGYDGELVYNSLKPDGVPRKILDSSKLYGLGWKPTIALKEGLEQTYTWYCDALSHDKAR